MRLGALATRQKRYAEAADHYCAASEIAPAFRLARTLLGDALLAALRRAGAAAQGARDRAAASPA
jgi:hypothetical protein